MGGMVVAAGDALGKQGSGVSSGGSLALFGTGLHRGLGVTALAAVQPVTVSLWSV